MKSIIMMVHTFVAKSLTFDVCAQAGWIDQITINKATTYILYFLGNMSIIHTHCKGLVNIAPYQMRQLIFIF